MPFLTGNRTEDNLLKQTVEGGESPLAYAIGKKGPVIDAKGVALGSDVNSRLLIDFLRSDRPISRGIREWLADMLDKGVATNANLVLKRRRGQPKKSMLEYQEAVEAFVERRKAGASYEAALQFVTEKMDIKEGTLKKAVAAIEEGVRIRLESIRNP